MLEQAVGVEHGHSFVKGLLSLWVFSAAVSALSPPKDRSSQFYFWVYRFGHLLAANLDQFQFTESLLAKQQTVDERT